MSHSSYPHLSIIIPPPSQKHSPKKKVAIEDIEINGKRQNMCADQPNKQCLAVMDTGSSLVTGPSSSFEPFMQKLPLDQKCKNLDQLPDLNILIKGDAGLIRYPLKPREYVLQTMNETTDAKSLKL